MESQVRILSDGGRWTSSAYELYVRAVVGSLDERSDKIANARPMHLLN